MKKILNKKKIYLIVSRSLHVEVQANTLPGIDDGNFSKII